MLSTILVYVSLFLQVAAAVIAISLFKRTKFNASWILISVGFLLMVVSRVFDLWPTIYPEMEDELAIDTEDSGFYHCFGPPDRSILYPENFSIYAKSG